MKPILRFIAFVLLTGILFYVSCKKEYSCESCREKNKPPIANAGRDTIIVLSADSVKLDGSLSSDPDGTITSFLWTKISGPVSFNINNATDVKTIAKNLIVGVYQFELKVTDNGGLSAKDTMNVIVNDPSQPNRPPVANAGADQTITLPTNTIILDGSASTDPDNNIVSYAWTKISGPSSFNIVNANAVQTQVANLVQGIYQFELKVTDAGGLLSRDTMQVSVFPETLANCGSLSQTFIGTLSIPRSSVSILTAGNKILFAGGFAGPPTGPPLYGASTRVDIYDKTAQTWSTADLSMTRFSMGTIALGNKIYFAGGDNGHPCSRVDIYDASNNTWSIAELSEARESVIAVAAGNKVLFAGGITNTGGSNKVDIYDQSNGTWSTAMLSGATSGSYFGKYEIDKSGVMSAGNKIYFITGDHNIDVYDALTNSWSMRTVNPNTLFGPAVVSMENKIYFPGTAHVNTSPDYSNTLEIYNIPTDSWSSINMLQSRSDMAAAAANGKIFWAGGVDSSWIVNGEDNVRYVQNIEIYDVNTGSHLFHNLLQNGNWVRTLKTNNKIFFAVSNNYTEIYDINSDSWSTCNNCFYQSIAIGNTVYQLGADDSQVWKLEY